MKKIILSLLVLALWPATLWADASCDSVPSNYGNWVNLTDGYTHDKDYNNPKMEVIIDGNTIHLCWMELTKVDNMRKIWYRRSTDLGKTWEDARVIMEVWEPYSDLNSGKTKVMSVNNGKVHIAAVHCTPTTYNPKIEGTSSLLYMRSDDGGETFGEKQELATIVSEYYRWFNCLIQSDGSTVVVATVRYDGAGKYIQRYFYSTDDGHTFASLKHTYATGSEHGLLDLQVSGTRFAVMYQTGDWYSGLIEGNMNVLCCDGSDMQVTDISPVCTKQSGNQAHFAYPNVMTGYNGDSFDYHPQMVLEGESVQVMYRANPGLEVLEPGGLDYAYTLYQRSDDFGKTWSEPTVLPDATGGAGTIAAKGDNVYIVTTYKGLHTVYHSHDRGASFAPVSQTVFPDNRYNPGRVFNLSIDPSDETGEHAYFSGNRFFFVETHDGFRTLSRNFCLGRESVNGTYYGNNYGLKVYPDDEGTEHWFMQLSKPTVVASPNGGYYVEEGARDIVFRRAETEASPLAEDMALNLADTLGPQHRVVVPMSPSLQQKQAITVECWVRPDNHYGFQIAACTDSETQEGSVFTGGWYIVQVPTYEGNLFYEGGICIDTDEFSKGVRVHYDWPSITINPDEGLWHHVALTYDDSVDEKNVCLYMDGVLAATNTIHGNMVLGKSPICLGRANGYYASQGLLDNFAVWARALSAEEILAHAKNPKANDGKDDDCRVLLTFDGTLQDQSQYGNDAVALLDVTLTAHDGIVTNGIALPTVDSRPASTDIFSIDGRRMDSRKALQKGIYIQNGQKVIIK